MCCVPSVSNSIVKMSGSKRGLLLLALQCASTGAALAFCPGLQGGIVPGPSRLRAIRLRAHANLTENGTPYSNAFRDLSSLHATDDPRSTHGGTPFPSQALSSPSWSLYFRARFSQGEALAFIHVLGTDF